jgi:hypothetical protein
MRDNHRLLAKTTDTYKIHNRITSDSNSKSLALRSFCVAATHKKLKKDSGRRIQLQFERQEVFEMNLLEDEEDTVKKIEVEEIKGSFSEENTTIEYYSISE